MNNPTMINNLKAIMIKKGITVKELVTSSNLSRSKIKAIRANPHDNINLLTIEKIMRAIDSTLNELIKDPKNLGDFLDLYFDIFLEGELLRNPHLHKKHYFGNENNRLLQKLFSQVGIQVSISPYNSFKSINLATMPFGVPIILRFNMKIHQEKRPYVTIQDSFIGVNTYYYELEKIIEACIDVIEKFTTKIDVDKLQIINYEGDHISPDLEQQTAAKIRSLLKHDYELANEIKSVSFIPPQILERRGYQISKSILGTLSFEKPLK
ncbi:helix-turn-helix domain-containing protein [Cytobacillus kochii]|uniref:helix-turn-helix domain-containing protein n=1 Tax=Cytobacillus kochii TaxID=859143 RepID=UPI00259FF666|nr:helix-turn-helix transcriptional regulator [Cytobacillus kochii]MDM5209819.1 helix-turn-helix transcriptional regulator [Cytobacillus kochii]